MTFGEAAILLPKSSPRKCRPAVSGSIPEPRLAPKGQNNRLAQGMLPCPGHRPDETIKTVREPGAILATICRWDRCGSEEPNPPTAPAAPTTYLPSGPRHGNSREHTPVVIGQITTSVVVFGTRTASPSADHAKQYRAGSVVPAASNLGCKLSE